MLPGECESEYVETSKQERQHVMNDHTQTSERARECLSTRGALGPCRKPTTMLFVAAVLVGFAMSLRGEQFLDDFEDGAVFDGEPVGWRLPVGWNNGVAEVRDGEVMLQCPMNEDCNLLLIPTASPNPDGNLEFGGTFDGDVSVRTHFRAEEKGDVYLMAHSVGGTFYIVWISSGGRTGLGRYDTFDDWTVLDQGTSSFRPGSTAEEIVLQLDMKQSEAGQRIEFRYWRPGEEMPRIAQVTAFDSTYRAGAVGLGWIGKEPGARAFFRYCEAADTMIEDPEPFFLRGDTNADGGTDLADGVFIVNHLFLGGEVPPCRKSADTNDTGDIDLTDAIFLLGGLFLGGAPPAPPAAGCGTDPTEDNLTCSAFPPCPNGPLLPASFTATPQTGMSPLEVSVDAAGVATAFDSFEWDFGDGNTAQGNEFNHRYTQPGKHRIVLSATTLEGRVARASREVSVLLRPGPVAPWQSLDLSEPERFGAVRMQEGCLQILGAEGVIGGRADTAHYVYQPRAGDFRFVGRLNTWNATETGSVAGLMVRESLEPGARTAAVVIEKYFDTFRHLFYQRTTGSLRRVRNDTYSALDVWLEIQREGDELRARLSQDGESWTEPNSIVVEDLADELLVGVTAAAREGDLGVADFCELTFE